MIHLKHWSIRVQRNTTRQRPVGTRTRPDSVSRQHHQPAADHVHGRHEAAVARAAVDAHEAGWRDSWCPAALQRQNGDHRECAGGTTSGSCSLSRTGRNEGPAQAGTRCAAHHHADAGEQHLNGLGILARPVVIPACRRPCPPCTHAPPARAKVNMVPRLIMVSVMFMALIMVLPR